MTELEQEVLSLPLKERKQLARVIRKSIVKDENATCAEERCELVKVVVESVTGHVINIFRQRQSDVTGRMYIAYIMYEDGYTLSEIGGLINRNHDSTLHLINKMKDMLSIPTMYRKEINMLNKIKERLCQSSSNESL